MSLKLGNDDVTGVKLGTQDVSAVYKGSDEVWSAGGGGANLATMAQSGPTMNRSILHYFSQADIGTASSKKTFEVWFRKTSAANQGLYSCIMGESRGYPYWAIGFNMGSPDSGASTIQVLNINYSDTYSWIDVTDNFTGNKWNHLAVQVEGGRMIVHLNGVKKGDKSAAGDLSLLTTNSYQCPGGASHRLTAFGDYFDHRVSEGWRYGTSNFALPASPFTPDADTIALTNRGEEFIDYSASDLKLIVGASLSKLDKGDTPYG